MNFDSVPPLRLSAPTIRNNFASAMKRLFQALDHADVRWAGRLTLLLALLCGIERAYADPLPPPTEETTLAPGVELQIWKLRDPVPRSVYAVHLDLTEAQIRPSFSLGGPDPDGPGEFHATNLTVLATAERMRFDIAVNAGVLVQPPESSNAGDGWGKAYPCTMINGRWLAPPPEESRATVVVMHRDGRFSIGPSLSVPDDAEHVFPTHTGQLVENGVACRLSKGDSSTATSQHPRTAIGIDESGTHITLLIVDGRAPGTATGTTTDTLEDWMVGLGVYDAANLWGGGNTALMLRERSGGPLRIFNEPSDRTPQGFITLRSAQTTLGFSIYGTTDANNQR